MKKSVWEKSPTATARINRKIILKNSKKVTKIGSTRIYVKIFKTEEQQDPIERNSLCEKLLKLYIRILSPIPITSTLTQSFCIIHTFFTLKLDNT